MSDANLFRLLKSKKYKPDINRKGNKTWYNDYNRLHRENDKPAIIFMGKSKSWYQNGILHRNNDKPSVIDNDGTKQWYTNGRDVRLLGYGDKIVSEPESKYSWWVFKELKDGNTIRIIRLFMTRY